MTLFKDRYRAESARLKGWDYSSVGYYFVTICTLEKLCTLGNVVDGVIRLSPVGEIVAEEWQKTAQIRGNVTLDEWVVMPNHVHGIICINDCDIVETHCNASLPKAQYSNVFGPQKNNLSSIVRGFKGSSTKRIHIEGHDFAWQSRFHDGIIRDEIMLERVREYISNNPMKWELDQDNPVNTGRDALQCVSTHC